MKITEVKDFMENDLPGLIQAESLQALFTTYKDVHGYKDGLVDTGSDKLKIVVLSGDHEYSSDVFRLLFTPDLLAISEGNRLGEEECRAAQDLVEGCFTEAKQSLNKEGKIIIFVYAGMAAFGEGLSFAGKMRQEFSDAKIVVLTCDCSLEMKEKKLSQVKEIDYAVISPECGGRRQMGEFLGHVIANWKPANVSG